MPQTNPAAGCRLDNYVLPAAADERFDESHWKELIYDDTPFEDQFAETASEGVVRVVCPFERAYGCILFCLGYDWVEGEGAAARLKRKLPVAHPRWPWLRASGVSVTYQLPGGEPVPVPVGVLQAPNKYARYTTVTVAVRFRNFGHLWLNEEGIYQPGGGPPAEYLRCLRVLPDPQPPEQMSADGLRTLAFTEPPLAGAKVSAPHAVLKQSVNYRGLWWRVPATWICDQWQPTKLTSFTGALNSADFLGFKAGTLRCDGVRLEPCEYPIRTANGPAYYYHVEFAWNHFDPPNLNPASVHRGHNLLFGTAPNGQVGWGYAADAGGPLWTVEKDFAKAFTAWDAP